MHLHFTHVPNPVTFAVNIESQSTWIRVRGRLVRRSTSSDTESKSPTKMALPPDMQALLEAMRGMIREEVQEAVNRQPFPPPPEGEDNEDDPIVTLTRKMEELQEVLKEKVSTEFDLENMGVKGMKKLPPKFTMPDIQKFSGIGDPKLHLKQYGSIMSAISLETEQKGCFSIVSDRGSTGVVP